MFESSHSSVSLVDVGTSCDIFCFDSSAPLLVDAALSFIKTFRLKGDVDSLKMLVKERFSPKEVEVGKMHLWDYGKNDLEANGLLFHGRRDSDKRSQMVANLDDVLKFFDVLYSLDKVPPIYCEA